VASAPRSGRGGRRFKSSHPDQIGYVWVLLIFNSSSSFWYNQLMTIKLLVTGGTIDARYNYLKALVDYDVSHIKNMLEQGRARVDIDIEQLMLLDSGNITDDQRQQILEKCTEASPEKIIVTHGTDTMVQTAKFLAGGGLVEKPSY
jgi:L-asparaginase/Glu-tRNA(Gln) amidotransferase subunit D